MSRGFTIVELLVVLLLVGLLASLAAPMFTGSVHQARESTLRENLYVLRKSLDDYYADRGHYPESLSNLVEHKYLREIPIDPMTEKNDTWVIETSQNVGEKPGIINVRSGSKLKSSERVAYETW